MNQKMFFAEFIRGQEIDQFVSIEVSKSPICLENKLVMRNEKHIANKQL